MELERLYKLIEVHESLGEKEFTISYGDMVPGTISTTTTEWEPQDYWDLGDPDGTLIMEESYTNLIAYAKRMGWEKFEFRWAKELVFNCLISPLLEFSDWNTVEPYEAYYFIETTDIGIVNEEQNLNLSQEDIEYFQNFDYVLYRELEGLDEYDIDHILVITGKVYFPIFSDSNDFKWDGWYVIPVD